MAALPISFGGHRVVRGSLRSAPPEAWLGFAARSHRLRTPSGTPPKQHIHCTIIPFHFILLFCIAASGALLYRQLTSILTDQMKTFH